MTGSRLVGRQTELAALLKAVDDGGCAIVDGESGTGKTRLLLEVVGRLSASGRRSELTAAGVARVPFAPFAHLLDSASAPAQDLIEQMVRVRQAIRQLAADGGVLLVDDAHLLDEGSTAMLHHLAHRREVPMVLAMRRDRSTALPSELSTAVGVSWVALGGLSRAESDELVAELSGPSAVDTDEVWRLADGNPLLIGELVDLARIDEQWNEPTSYTRSTRLRQVVGSRLDRLRSEDRSFLEAIAVAESLPRTAAERLLPLVEIATLERLGLVRLEHRGGEPVVSPGHELHREMALALCGEAGVEVARRAAIEALEEVGDERSLLVAARLRLDSGLLDPRRLEVASELALRSFDAESAAEFAAGAIAGGSRFTGPLLKASAFGELGRHEEADRLLSDLLRLTVDPTQRVTVTLAQARSDVMWRGDRDTAERRLRSGIDAVGPDHDPPLRALLGSVLFFGGRPADALDACAPLLAQRTFPVDAVLPVGSARSALGDPDGVIDVVDRVRDVLRHSGPADVDPVLMLNAPFVLMLARWQRGELIGAHPFEAFSGPTWHPALDSPPAFLLPASVEFMRGHLDAMSDSYERLAEFVDVGPTQWVAMHRILLVMMHSIRGEVAAARARRDELRDLPPQIVKGLAWWVGRSDALLRCAEGDRSGAVVSSLELCETHADELFHRAVSLHDVVRFGESALVLEATEVLGRRPGATWFDRVVAAHARAAAACDAAALIVVSRTFESGGLDLYALEAMAQAVAAASSPAEAQQPRGEVARLAMVCGTVHTPAVVSVPTWLTERESEVATLAASGLSNKEIAVRLGTSPRTVGNQLQSVYQKLGVSSRSELVRPW